MKFILSEKFILQEATVQEVGEKLVDAISIDMQKFKSQMQAIIAALGIKSANNYDKELEDLDSRADAIAATKRLPESKNDELLSEFNAYAKIIDDILKKRSAEKPDAIQNKLAVAVNNFKNALSKTPWDDTAAKKALQLYNFIQPNQIKTALTGSSDQITDATTLRAACEKLVERCNSSASFISKSVVAQLSSQDTAVAKDYLSSLSKLHEELKKFNAVAIPGKLEEREIKSLQNEFVLINKYLDALLKASKVTTTAMTQTAD